MTNSERKLARSVLDKLTIALCVVILYCISDIIQKHALYAFSFGPASTLFYLPAAVITLGSLISPIASLGGIFVGAFICNYLVHDVSHFFEVMLVSLVPVIAAATAVISTCYFNPRFRDFHHLKERFSQIDAIDIFYFCSLYSVINVSLLKLILYFGIQDPVAFPPVMVLAMAFGDLTGSFLVFIILSLLFSLYLKLR